MPPIKPTEDEMKTRELCGLISYYQCKKDMTNKALALKAYIPYSTLIDKLRKPNSFTYGELKKIAAVLGFSKEERGEFI